MPRHIDPIIGERTPSFIFEKSFEYDFKVDPAKFGPSILSHTELYPQSVKALPSTVSSWEDTIEKCITSIVSIKSCRTRGLDTEVPGSFTATGFVVDPERGIILSNRHVVSVSPVTACAVFCNYEEIDLKPIYRDPVHDFGFFQYDPLKLRFLEIPGIKLHPKGAKIGQDIRVVGNDAGEKLSILSGTLARLDREAPEYGIGEYNDFNTFYYQAASGTSSGSSGSPVLDIQGRAIALNAGGAQTSSSSYYLPLDRVHRALMFIQNEKPVPRGTLQTTFDYQSYDTLISLGLGRHIEKRLRSQPKSSDNPNEGLLVVKSVLQDGPGYGYLEPGDILLTCNEQLLPGLFIDLEQHMDDAISLGTSINVVVSRSGELKEYSLMVKNLHDITPHRYLEFGGGILNDLSYQVARSYGLSLETPGVYVGAAGFILGTAQVLRKSVIVAINNSHVGSLEDFLSAVSGVPQGSRIPIRYYSLSKPMRTKVMILQMDWRWHKLRMAVRNDQTGLWDYTTLKTPLLKNNPLQAIDTTPYSHHDVKKKEKRLLSLQKSIVSVDCYSPFIIDGIKSSHSYGAGVVVSMDPPLIICDRDTVPVGISVISLTFNNSITISADLIFLHPFYNFAVLKFDPSLVFKSNIDIIVADLDDGSDLKVGDTINYIGLSGQSEINFKKTYITHFAPIRTSETSPPRWRATNVETFKVSDGTLSSQGGIFADDEGKVKAIWMSFSIDNERREQSSVLGGLPAKFVLPIVEQIKSQQPLSVRGLDVEFWILQISNARLLGVSDAWIEAIKRNTNPVNRPSVVYILGIADISSPSGKLLKVGDIVLSINGEALSSISDLEHFSDKNQLDMTIVRDGQGLELSVPTTRYDGKETTEVVGWQGMLIQETYASAKEQAQKVIPEGVYVSCCLFGSPAQASLKPGIWITEIDQTPVKTLKVFLNMVKSGSFSKRKTNNPDTREFHANGNDHENLKKNNSALLAPPTRAEIEELVAFSNRSHIQIKFVTASNVTQVRALKMDRHYWPTWHISKNDDSVYGWDMTFIS
ncbi:hypothetical protein INT47_007580 [Mucor saturninus]|uniref:PDZ domain-containing protein n=1 Tax=Mucor saturninus TaxID=64648 RepID=A0A8H7R9G4_9FUNG|nr:hypothetical protein INT47_007580 [Mucor saturninus]